MLNPQKLAAFRSQLLQTKQEIQNRFGMNEHFGLKRSHAHDSVGELSSIDNHPGDEATELYEREKDIALNEHIEEELEDINRALQAIEKGKYGTCEVCGKEIPEERLEAIPTATTCREHAREEIVSHNRPIEEGVLMPPFGKFEFDGEDVEAYDAEDTLQEVARYGSSESPSDLDYPVDHYNDVYLESDDPVGYVEDYENFAATDLYGNEVNVYPGIGHEQYEDMLDEEGLMTPFGDLPGYEKDPYTDDNEPS
ncbi:yteA family sporulation protein [Metabacillus arenae]|uniref:YteA family sporulation protein n=1 Tax=Metabacillus arenae TaxID=2771434 RepID=A0A926S0R0_9BACI|nr:yteA family sporulation protein [Metabacillus arenae]MBD1380269.1 yteA family sporulation protein [Metabacillus arenae]